MCYNIPNENIERRDIMGLNKIFSSMKKEGYVVRPLEMYLLNLSARDSDRALNVNAPSAVGQCLRARYYTRTNAPCDSFSVDARTRRIFDNGTCVHERLQSYLKSQGMLLMDEVPLVNEYYNIQGHTDGILKLSDRELGVLEIKSINSKGFSELKSEKPEHRKQGLVYLYCLEEHRKYLHSTYATREDLIKSSAERSMKYYRRYSYLKDGRKFKREEKIRLQVNLCKKLDEILYNCETPITKVIFLYENKDTQDLKEYCVSSTEPQSVVLMEEILSDFNMLNKAVELAKVPKRPVVNKNDNMCRWCSYKTECWN